MVVCRCWLIGVAVFLEVVTGLSHKNIAITSKDSPSNTWVLLTGEITIKYYNLYFKGWIYILYELFKRNNVNHG